MASACRWAVAWSSRAMPSRAVSWVFCASTVACALTLSISPISASMGRALRPGSPLRCVTRLLCFALTAKHMRRGTGQQAPQPRVPAPACAPGASHARQCVTCSPAGVVGSPLGW